MLVHLRLGERPPRASPGQTSETRATSLAEDPASSSTAADDSPTRRLGEDADPIGPCMLRACRRSALPVLAQAGRFLPVAGDYSLCRAREAWSSQALVPRCAR